MMKIGLYIAPVLPPGVGGGAPPSGNERLTEDAAGVSTGNRLNEDGVTFVVKAGDVFEELGTNPLAEDDMCMATPAIADDRLIIRTSARVYCIKSARAKSGE